MKNLVRRRRLEEAVSAQLSAWGPFIAIGQPGEELPDLGTFRAYFKDDEWQKAIVNWVCDCKLVVRILGMTDSVK